jgi:hypothetical protein
MFQRLHGVLTSQATALAHFSIAVAFTDLQRSIDVSPSARNCVPLPHGPGYPHPPRTCRSSYVFVSLGIVTIATGK